MISLVKKSLLSWPVLGLIEVLGRRSENRMAEFGMIAQAFEFKKINHIEGDYFEFGLWRGKTFVYAHKMMQRYKIKGVKLRGFDSFEGLPAHEDSQDNIWNEGQFCCSETEFRKIMRENGISENEYELIPGFYSKILNTELNETLSGVKAAIVYIDCDLYESTIDVLKFIKKYLINGTIVCFDDYFNYCGATDQGEARALDEFLQANKTIRFIPYFNFSPLGKSFIVRLN